VWRRHQFPGMESLFNGDCVAGLSDRQLIERLTTRRDSTGEAAFAALVARHGPIVLSVCQQLLGDRHSAEDAFQAVFLVFAPGYGAGWVELDPDAGRPAGDITLRPEQVIQGRLFGVHGRPAQGVEVSVESMQTAVAGSPDMILNDTVGPYFFRVQPGNLPAWPNPAKSDADGLFRANPGSAHRYLLSSFPPEREPYLNVGKKLDWPRRAIEHSLDLVLPRGILVRGRITEDGSGKPIAGARIGYLSTSSIGNPAARARTSPSRSGRALPSRAASSGRTARPRGTPW
jgi:hypothetical protein